MRFTYSINDDPTLPDVASGFLDAANMGEALRMLGNPRANVCPLAEAEVGIASTSNAFETLPDGHFLRREKAAED